MSEAEQVVGAFLSDIRWEDYQGATVAFAAVRRADVLQNLVCRIVLSRVLPKNWDFADEVDELVIRRSWMSIDEARTQIEGLSSGQLAVASELLVFRRDADADYGWTHLLPGFQSRKTVGWRGPSLIGLGENQWRFLGAERFEQLGQNLLTARKRSFSGWPNLSAFLGNKQQPLEISNRGNTLLECYAPIYARIEKESRLGDDGALSVWVRCALPIAREELAVLIRPPGAEEPPRLELTPIEGDLYFASARAVTRPRSLSLSLLAKNRLADEVDLRVDAEVVGSKPVLETPKDAREAGARTKASDPPAEPTLVEKWKRKASNQPFLAGLALLFALIVAVGAVAGAISAVRGLFLNPENSTTAVFYKGDAAWRAISQDAQGYKGDWRALDFDDSAWPSALSPAPDLGSLSLGQSEMVTMWCAASRGGGNIALFRRVIEVSDRSKLRHASLLTISDDDHKVWINGTLAVSDVDSAAGPLVVDSQ